ncbi:YARHG domain-containing protein [Pseudoramibacter sp. HA2172]|uniref:YARHG domain-containing protein n=1 Tax=Pseudoramibacter faecis TaxID=3108534 RepID=UPI002E77E8AD|nr:YARHG domain-containing protein [Pseudoramibacter sp. HA2172]
MYCSKCGHSIKDRDQFCPNCGAPNPRAEAGAQSAMNPTQVQPVYPPPKREKSNHSLALIIIATVAAAAIVFAALYFVLNRPRSRLSSEKTTKVTVNNYDSDGNKTSGTASDSRSAANRSNHQIGNSEIFPTSSSTRLSSGDLTGLSAKTLNYARNEIYARNGRLFDSGELQSYFNNKSWYNGTTLPGDFDEDSLSSVEKYNVQLLKSREDALGGYQVH